MLGRWPLTRCFQVSIHVHSHNPSSALDSFRQFSISLGIPPVNLQGPQKARALFPEYYRWCVLHNFQVCNCWGLLYYAIYYMCFPNFHKWTIVDLYHVPHVLSQPKASENSLTELDCVAGTSRHSGAVGPVLVMGLRPPKHRLNKHHEWRCIRGMITPKTA